MFGAHPNFLWPCAFFLFACVCVFVEWAFSSLQGDFDMKYAGSPNLIYVMCVCVHVVYLLCLALEAQLVITNENSNFISCSEARLLTHACLCQLRRYHCRRARWQVRRISWHQASRSDCQWVPHFHKSWLRYHACVHAGIGAQVSSCVVTARHVLWRLKVCVREEKQVYSLTQICYTCCMNNASSKDAFSVTLFWVIYFIYWDACANHKYNEVQTHVCHHSCTRTCTQSSVASCWFWAKHLVTSGILVCGNNGFFLCVNISSFN